MSDFLMVDCILLGEKIDTMPLLSIMEKISLRERPCLRLELPRATLEPCLQT